MSLWDIPLNLNHFLPTKRPDGTAMNQFVVYEFKKCFIQQHAGLRIQEGFANFAKLCPALGGMK